MPYQFLDFLPAEGDSPRRPDLADDAEFLLLADLAELPWGLFDVKPCAAESAKPSVTERLASLIDSAKRYPPALALAREEITQVFGDHRPDPIEFGSAYAVALQTHLQLQHEAPYVLAPAMKDDEGYLVKGQWYWLLKISGSPPSASWVSDDYHVYQDDMDDFDLTGQQLKRLGYAG